MCRAVTAEMPVAVSKRQQRDRSPMASPHRTNCAEEHRAELCGLRRCLDRSHTGLLRQGLLRLPHPSGRPAVLQGQRRPIPEPAPAGTEGVGAPVASPLAPSSAARRRGRRRGRRGGRRRRRGAAVGGGRRRSAAVRIVAIVPCCDTSGKRPENALRRLRGVAAGSCGLVDSSRHPSSPLPLLPQGRAVAIPKPDQHQ